MPKPGEMSDLQIAKLAVTEGKIGSLVQARKEFLSADLKRKSDNINIVNSKMETLIKFEEDLSSAKVELLDKLGKAEGTEYDSVKIPVEAHGLIATLTFGNYSKNMREFDSLIKADVRKTADAIGEKMRKSLESRKSTDFNSELAAAAAKRRSGGKSRG